MQLQQTDKAYVTVTTVPSLDNCRDCQKIASSYEEDGLLIIQQFKDEDQVKVNK